MLGMADAKSSDGKDRVALRYENVVAAGVRGALNETSRTFACDETLALAPEDVARQILDLTKWPDFHGYGPLPGIKAAEFEVKTSDIVGSRIRVTNQDGSSHVEEIVEWQPTHRIRLHMKEFSLPLSRLATLFTETWEFERVGNETKVTRSFEMNAKSLLAWPVLWMISFMLKTAIARHLREMRTKSILTKEC